MDTTVRRPKFRIWAALSVWGILLVTLCAYMLGGHFLTLPTPELDNPTLAAALKARSSSGAVAALHILYGDCGCSRRVLHHLRERGPSALAEETVVLVDPREGDVGALRGAGFPVEVVDASDLQRVFDVAAAPLLVVSDAAGALAYVGGYTDRKRGPDIADVRILAAVSQGEDPRALPLFGCAVNQTLAAKVDPFGLR